MSEKKEVYVPPTLVTHELLRDITAKYGILLIFDEVITGFRVSIAGAQGHYGIRPDLSIFGKAVANGMPMSVMAGREDLFALIASGQVGHGGTYNSLPPVIAAGVATLNILERNGGEVYRKLNETGTALMDGIRERAAKLGVPVIVQGHPSIFFVGFPVAGATQKTVVDYKTSLATDNDLYAQFVSAMADNGVRIIPRGNWFLSAAHTLADVEQTDLFSLIDERPRQGLAGMICFLHPKGTRGVLVEFATPPRASRARAPPGAASRSRR